MSLKALVITGVLAEKVRSSHFVMAVTKAAVLPHPSLMLQRLKLFIFVGVNILRMVFCAMEVITHCDIF
jgi:hypothetical protein